MYKRQDIAIRLLRPVKELGGKDFHAAIQGNTVNGWTFQESHTVGAAGGSQNTIHPQKFQPLIPAIQHQHVHHADVYKRQVPDSPRGP